MGRASKLAKCLATGREGRVGFETDDYGLGGEDEKSGGIKNAAQCIGYWILHVIIIT